MTFRGPVDMTPEGILVRQSGREWKSGGIYIVMDIVVELVSQ